MKRMVCLYATAAFLLLAAGCASTEIPEYPQPEFDKARAQIIDTAAIPGHMEDNVKFHNETLDSGLSFAVYMHDMHTGQWIPYGPAVLKGFGDTDTIDSPYADTLKKYRYFAVENRNDKAYNLHFSKSRNDLHITVRDN